MPRRFTPYRPKQRGVQMDITDFTGPLDPTSDMGGTIGGERERGSKSNILVAWTWDSIAWPGPDEPEIFWGHWLQVGDRYPDTEGGW